MKKFIISVTIVLVGVLSFLYAPHIARAMDPNFLVTWKANTFIPTWYLGKSFPVENSSVVVSFDAIGSDVSNFGKILDLSNKSVRWYVNNKLVRSGNGLHKISISNKMVAGSEIDIRIAFEYYDEQGRRSYYPETTFSIPVKNPKVIIENVVRSDIISTNSSILLKSIPFFFNGDINSLIPSWVVDHKKILDNSSFNIDINLGNNAPSSGKIGVVAMIKDMSNNSSVYSSLKTLLVH